MDDRRRHDEPEVPDPSETVRIIGEDEAEEALRSGSAASRRPSDAKRPLDRPDPPPAEAKPSLRFPRGEVDEGGPRPRPRRSDATTELPHWTDPPTGEVPAFSPEEAQQEHAPAHDAEAWSTFATGAPRWRDQPSDWEAADYDDASRLADDSTRVGALDPRRARHDDLFGDIPQGGGELTPEPEPLATEPPPPPPPGTGPVTSAPPQPASVGADLPMGRNVGVAVGTGVAFAAVALFLMSQGPAAVTFLVAVVLVLAAAELFSAFQRAGYHPATLLGLVATLGLAGGTYWRGEVAHPLILALTVAFGFLWYLTGVSSARPVANVGVTVLGVAYVGVLGSFATLMLRWPNDDGIGLLLGAVIATIGYDVGGFFIGRRIGQSPLAPQISPNKTYEGLVGGMATAVLLSVLVVARIHPWDFGSALALGIVASVAAPIGDLTESLLKRDLGVKDSSGILPGHGGILDRFDGLLFVLPATYYLAQVLDLGLG